MHHFNMKTEIKLTTAKETKPGFIYLYNGIPCLRFLECANQRVESGLIHFIRLDDIEASGMTLRPEFAVVELGEAYVRTIK